MSVTLASGNSYVTGGHVVPSTRQARIAIAALGAALLIAASPVPAHADTPQVWLDSDVGASAIAVGSAGKTVPVWYRAGGESGAVLPAIVRVRIDASAAKSLTVGLAGPIPGCAQAAAVITCSRPADVLYTPAGDLRVTLKPALGAKAGDVATISLTTTADGIAPSVENRDITLSAPGPDLQVGRLQTTGAPGGTAQGRPTIRNTGDRTATTILLSLGTGSYSTFTTRHRNCHYQHDDYGFEYAVCLLEKINLKPGEALTFAEGTPLKLTISPNVPGQLRINRYDPPRQPYSTYASYYVDVFDTKPVDERLAWPLGTGPALSFQRTAAPKKAALAASAVDPSDDWANLGITVTPNNPTDMAAAGASIGGRVGDVVSLKVGIANNGPADVVATPDGKGGDAADPYNAGLRFTVPSGVKVVEVIPPPGFLYQNWYEQPLSTGTSYLVLPFSLKHGERYTIEFKVRITSAAPSYGTVVAQGGTSDPRPSDNSASVSVNCPSSR
jgi:hypothetical protein